MIQTLLLSIIIPVHNVEKYICQCLETLAEIIKLNNTEIILVDDGSTDRSGVICDDFSAKYNNVSVIHQENKGLSEARNKGLLTANGEYVIFLDSDDMLYGEELQKNLILLNKGYDIIVYDWNTVSEDGREIIKKYKHDGISNGEYSCEDYIYRQIKKSKYYWTIACQGIYKREFLLSKQLFFKEGIYHEDDLWFPQVVLSTSTIYYLEETIYVYRMRDNSITKDNHKNDSKHMEDIIYIYGYLYEYITKHCQNINTKNKMRKDISKRYLFAIYNYRAYLFKGCCKKIDKIQILRNCFWGDVFRCLLLILNDKLYYVLMSNYQRIKVTLMHKRIG